jgi:uncharacterized membrane protein
MSPPLSADTERALARYTPDGRKWRRRVAVVAAVTAPLAAYAALAIISGVKSGIVYNLLIAVFGLLALTLPAVAVAALLAPDSESPRATPARDADSVETLKRRYAAGEIGDDEFERRLDALVESERPSEGATRGTRSSRGRTRASGEVESSHR